MKTLVSTKIMAPAGFATARNSCITCECACQSEFCLSRDAKRTRLQFLGGAQGTLSLCLELPEPPLDAASYWGHLGAALLPERLPLFVGIT